MELSPSFIREQREKIKKAKNTLNVPRPLSMMLIMQGHCNPARNITANSSPKVKK